VEFYRIYHIDAKGEISGLRNFTADSDVLACEQAVAIMAESKWSGIELWEGMRQVHCVGITRGTVDAPNVSPQELVPSLRPHQSLL
jgi:hypothetical protein